MIFVIRTKRNPFRSRPNPILVGTSLGVVALGHCSPTRRSEFSRPLAIADGNLARGHGRVYLLLAELVKRWFYLRQPPHWIALTGVLQ